MPSRAGLFSDAALGNVPGVSTAVLDLGFVTGPSGRFTAGKVADALAPGESASFTVSGAAFAGFIEEQICSGVYVRFKDDRSATISTGPDSGRPTPEGGPLLCPLPRSASRTSFR